MAPPDGAGRFIRRALAGGGGVVGAIFFLGALGDAITFSFYSVRTHMRTAHRNPTPSIT